MNRRARLAKLRAMPPRELLARAAYHAYTAHERRRHRQGRLASPDRLRNALERELARLPDWEDQLLARVGRARFFPSLDEPDRVRTVFGQRYPDEWQASRRVADEVAGGEVGFFGRRFRVGPEIDWHADPVTGAGWPRVYHRDVSVSKGDVGFGDVKDVWEINRHQFFVDLAKIAFMDRSAAHAGALHRLLAHWMRDVPYATGVPWSCALEPAFRVWSWMWAYHFVRAAGLLDTDTHMLWLTGFYDHGRFLHRHLEHHTSPYNHLIGEASALFALGLLCPVFEEAERWRDRGRRTLESTVHRQFHTDGGSVEQSTFYHHATLGFYMLAAILGRANGCDLAPNVWSAIERGVEFSAALAQPDGRVPRIGGADDGKPIRLEQLPFWNFRPYYAIGAVLFARRDFRFAAGRFWEDAFWLLGPDGLEAFERLEPEEPARTAALPASGYYVVRSDWSQTADYLCFDCGEQAGGLRRDDVPSAAHGHADCLSVVVSLGGREVLVDPGFFCYNGDPVWEVHFRKTTAHNTVVVDGQDQAQHVSKMAWTRTYAARPEGWSTDRRWGWARGSHNGYARLPQPVTHRRTAWLRPDGYVVIYDELAGTPGHVATAVFQFAPGSLAADDSRATFDDRYDITWSCSVPAVAQTACGGNLPSEGWIATSLGVREPAPRLTLTFEMEQPRAVLVTVVADRNRSAGAFPRLTQRARTPGWVRMQVACADAEDEVAAATTEGASMDGVETDAPLLIVRRVGGVLMEVAQAGGTYARMSPQLGASFGRAERAATE